MSAASESADVLVKYWPITTTVVALAVGCVVWVTRVSDAVEHQADQTAINQQHRERVIEDMYKLRAQQNVTDDKVDTIDERTKTTQEDVKKILQRLPSSPIIGQ